MRYYHRITKIRNLSFSIQFLFLSIIFSSQFEELYKKKMLIEKFKYIHDFIYKRNVRYIMKIMKKDDIQLSILQFIKSAIDKYKEKKKILEFYKIHQEYNDYAEYLSCESYISIETNEEYEEILND